MKKLKVTLAAVLVLCMGILLCACASSKDPTVKVGNDEVPTLFSAVGERSISGTSKGFENDIHYVTLTYKSGAVSEDDLKSYMNLLIDDEGFLYTKDSAVEDNVLTLQLGKESVDEGKIILIDVQYPQLGSVEISYKTGTGTITPTEPETIPDSETTVEPEVPDEPETSTKPETNEPVNTDVSAAVDPTTTSDINAVPVGQWVKTALYATEDKTYHTVYVRITKITTQSDDAAYVQSASDLHNASSYDFQQINLDDINLPSDVELCVLDYEVFVPENFPGPDYGITEPKVTFNQSNIGGGGIPSADGTTAYIGLGSNTEDLALEPDPTYQPGNTYALRSLYTMVKGYTDYVLEFTSYPDGTVETSVDVMYHAYFDNK